MLPPIRCYTCNNLIQFRQYEEHLYNKCTPAQALDNIDVHLYCCRRMYLGIQDGLTDILSNTVCTGFSDDLNKLELGVASDRVIKL